jgi:hypothetical protein
VSVLVLSRRRGSDAGDIYRADSEAFHCTKQTSEWLWTRKIPLVTAYRYGMSDGTGDSIADIVTWF